MLPLALTCGSTLRITPVLRSSIWLTIGVFELERIVAVPVLIGTSSPTCKSAGWLSIATIDGEERTLTSVTLDSALRITFGDAFEPSSKLKPGAAVFSAAAPIACAVVPTNPAATLLLFDRKYWTPYC